MNKIPSAVLAVAAGLALAALIKLDLGNIEQAVMSVFFLLLLLAALIVWPRNDLRS